MERGKELGLLLLQRAHVFPGKAFCSSLGSDEQCDRDQDRPNYFETEWFYASEDHNLGFPLVSREM